MFGNKFEKLYDNEIHPFLIGKAYTPNPYNFQMGIRRTHVEAWQSPPSLLGL